MLHLMVKKENESIKFAPQNMNFMSLSTFSSLTAIFINGFLYSSSLLYIDFDGVQVVYMVLCLNALD